MISHSKKPGFAHRNLAVTIFSATASASAWAVTELSPSHHQGFVLISTYDGQTLICIGEVCISISTDTVNPESDRPSHIEGALLSHARRAHYLSCSPVLFAK